MGAALKTFGLKESCHFKKSPFWKKNYFISFFSSISLAILTLFNLSYFWEWKHRFNGELGAWHKERKGTKEPRIALVTLCPPPACQIKEPGKKASAELHHAILCSSICSTGRLRSPWTKARSIMFANPFKKSHKKSRQNDLHSLPLAFWQIFRTLKYEIILMIFALLSRGTAQKFCSFQYGLRVEHFMGHLLQEIVSFPTTIKERKPKSLKNI